MRAAHWTTTAITALALVATASVAAGVAPAAPAGTTVLRDAHPARQVSVSIGVRHDDRGVVRRLHRTAGTPAPLAAVVRRHGASTADIRVIRRWAASNGLVAAPGRLRTRVVVRGPVRAMQSALGARIRHHRARSGRTYLAASRPLRVPRALRRVATGIAGLSHVAPPVRGGTPRGPGTRAARERQAPATPVLQGCATGPAVDMQAAGNGMPVTPVGVARAYGFDSIGAASSYPPQSIAILEIGQNYLPSDVAQYQRDCRFSPGTIDVQQVNLPGAPTLEGTDGNAEANLDAQWVSALAPAGTRVVVINVSPTSPTWLVDFLEQAVALPALAAASISYSASEVQSGGAAASPPAEYVQYQHAMAMMAASGPSVFVAAGDQGSMGPPASACPTWFPSYGLPGQASVNWLAASPGVTAVGGTMWPGYLRPADEPVWNQAAGVGPIPWICGPAGGGGGKSVISARPPWQAAAGSGIPGTTRLLPDLAMLSGLPGFATITNGRPSATAGTSAAAPVLAAAVLRINAERRAAGKGPVGFLNPLLYGRLAPTFRDVVTGGNDIFGNGICCAAGPGFDMASGLGSPDIGAWPALIP